MSSEQKQVKEPEQPPVVVVEVIEREPAKKCCTIMKNDVHICFKCCTFSWAACLNGIECCCLALSTCCVAASELALGCRACLEQIDCDGH